MKNQYILVIDPSPISVPIFKAIKSLGLSSIALVTSSQSASCQHAQTLADIEIHYDDYISRDDNHALFSMETIAGAICLSETSKFIENRICSELGLPSVSVQTLNMSRDKSLMRKALTQAGVDDLEYQVIADTDSLPEPSLQFPFIMKPTLGFASTGVTLVRNRTEYLKSASLIRRLNHMALKKFGESSAGILCEPFLKGVEIAIDAMTAGSKTKIFGISHRLYVSDENFQDHVYYTDTEKFSSISLEITPLLEKALSAIGYTNGPSHVEFRKDPPTGKWHVIDIGLRVGAGGNMGVMIEASSGVQYLGLAIQASRGPLRQEEIENEYKVPTRHSFFMVLDGGTGGKIAKIRGMDELSRNPDILHFAFPKQAGQWIQPYPLGADYPGIIVGASDTKTGMTKLIDSIKAHVGIEYVR